MGKSERRKHEKKPPRPDLPTDDRRGGLFLLLCAILAITTLAAFWHVTSCSFVGMDDNVYVYDNAHVKNGLSWNNIRWAFSVNVLGMYEPLSLISHMIDVEIFGMKAGGHHFTNLLLHILSSLLLFAGLRRMTGEDWKSFAAAALFALHPLHVESVAWISERKDVLSAFFWFLAILAYARYSEKPSPGRYCAVFAAFACGLLAKPMVITLPFVLLLLDYWPLGRLRTDGFVSSLRRLVWEKSPFFAMIPVFALIAFSTQKQVVAVVSLPIGQRLSNSVISYAGYLRRMLLPLDLSPYYVLPKEGPSFLKALVSGLAISAITVLVLWLGRNRKYLATGWFWYIGTLVPVIGIVQIGLQAMADRYTYIPLTGVFIILSWAGGEIAATGPLAKRAVKIAAVAVLAVCFAMTRVQAGYWTDNFTLFERIVAVQPGNWFGHSNLGAAFKDSGKPAEALVEYKKALETTPRPASTLNDIGIILAQSGKKEEAIASFREAVRIMPGYGEARCNLGSALTETGRFEEAIEQFGEALRTEPASARAMNGLGNALTEAGRHMEAVDVLTKAISIDPNMTEARMNLGFALAKAGRMREAAEQFMEAVKLDPGSELGYLNLGVILGQAGKYTEAADCFRKALEIWPDSAEAQANLEIMEKALRETPR